MQFVESLLTRECKDAAYGRWPGVEAGSKRRDRPVAIRVFNSGILELFGKAHWVTPLIWFSPLIALGLYRGSQNPLTAGWRTPALFLMGWLFWTLLEYVLHRFLFHLEARSDNDRIRAFLFHGYHHDFPNDPMHLVAPPMMSWGPALLVGTLMYFVLGPNHWLQVMAGAVSGYVAYDLIHYYTHHGRPTWWLGKALRRYHMEHHYRDGGASYGVSSPLWDYVLGTRSAANTGARRQAARRPSAAGHGQGVVDAVGAGLERTMVIERSKDSDSR